MEADTDPAIDRYVCEKNLMINQQISLKDLESYSTIVDRDAELRVLSAEQSDDSMPISDVCKGIHEESIGDPELSSTRNEDLFLLEKENLEVKDIPEPQRGSLQENLDENTLLQSPLSFWTLREEPKADTMSVQGSDTPTKRPALDGRFSRTSTFSEHSHFSDLEVMQHHPDLDQLENVEVSIKVSHSSFSSSNASNTSHANHFLIKFFL